MTLANRSAPSITSGTTTGTTTGTTNGTTIGTTISAPRDAAQQCANLLQAFASIKRGHLPVTLPLAGALGRLIPVTDDSEGDATLLSEFARWRAGNMFAFPTQFAVTCEGTARWLRAGLLDVPDRLLFLVQTPDGTNVGHLGFASCAVQPGVMEIDNVVRGVQGSTPGIMAAAMQALTDWAQHAFTPHQIFLRVFSDNAHAVTFYERCGYHHDVLLPLRRTDEPGRIAFATPASNDLRAPDKFFARMILQPNGVSY